MGLRARLAGLFLALLLVPILWASVISLDYMIGMLIDDLSRSSDLMIEQIFEQIRLTASESHGDVKVALQKSQPLRNLLDSTEAFGPAVVSASVVAPDGTIIVAAHGEGEGLREPALRSLSELQARAARRWLFASLPSLMTAAIYQARRRVEIDNRPTATISIGVTTALIADKARHLLLMLLMTACVVTAIAWLVGTLIANRILRQVAAIREGFEQLAAGKKPVEVRIEGEDEIGLLAAKFNELSRQVHADRSRLDNDSSHLFDVIRSIQDAVVLLDSNGTVLFANKEAGERLNTRSGSMEGAPLSSVLDPDHPLLPLIQSTLGTGAEAHDVPLQLGSGRSFLVSFLRLGHGRAPAGLLMVLRNLEPLLELENALDSSTRLAHLGTLISGMAHQLRSPLHGMNLRLELLRDDHGDNAERHIDKLRQEVTRLDQSIEAILRFMRPADLKLVDFDVNDLLTELGARVKNERVQVEYRLEATEKARADRMLIAEALINVITNATQAMPHGGVLTLATSTKDSTVEIAVADQGTGIPEKKLPRIFDLYYTTKSTGHGLGLPFALRAVELNRGKIAIESHVGKGTVCTIILPVASNAPARTTDVTTT